LSPEALGRTAPLPAETEPAAAAAPAAAAPAPRAPSSQPRRCLLVDDSRVVRKVANRIISSLGYVVTEAENGEEALARCKAAMPDLILLDWEMPVMTGVQFVAALRQIGGGMTPKVVFCTSKSDAPDIHKGIDAGADEYVTKPFDEQTLLAKLQRIGAA
jgi:two-component system chemotaxis response regulator CheY